MQKYRLVWDGAGSLDLSQVLDERGVPVIFAKRGAAVIVDGLTFKHPLVQNYLTSGLKATPLGGPAAPAVPVVAPAAPPPPPKPVPPVVTAAPAPKPVPPPVKEPEPPKPDTVTVSLRDTVKMEEEPVAPKVSEDSPPDEETEEPDAPEKPKGGSKRRGRGR